MKAFFDTNIRARRAQQASSGLGHNQNALSDFRQLLSQALTLATHEKAVQISRDDGLSIFDALIVAAAIESGCDTLFSEDLQNGRAFGRLRIVNPFS